MDDTARQLAETAAVEKTRQRILFTAKVDGQIA